MKPFKNILVFSALLLLMLCCSKSDDLLSESSQYQDLGNGEAKQFLLKSEFTVWDFSNPDDHSCGEDPNSLLVLKGEGTVAGMGEISATVTLCYNAQTCEYRNGSGILESGNGDAIYFNIPYGKICVNEDCNCVYYQRYFNDVMYISGGEGLFHGASGTGHTNAFIHEPDPDNETDIWHTDFMGAMKITIFYERRSEWDKVK